MPTYEYSCPKCGDFEVYQSIKDATLTVCPTCKSKKLTKRISTGGGVIFSGSGFWETDYNRSKDYSSKKKSEATPAAAPAATPAATPAASTPAAAPAKSDSKPAKVDTKTTKSESKPASPPPAK